MRSYPMILALTIALGACSGGSGDGGAPDGGGNGCSLGDTQCDGNVYQGCDENGQWVDLSTCAGLCSADIGCVSCLPEFNTLCQGDTVYTCNPDGSIGGVVDTCDPGQCVNGACQEPLCGAGADLVYVIDQDYRLLSFDPRLLEGGQDPFTLIGPVSCPTQASAWPGWTNPPTPFSMSVDRDATAWVLFTNGEIHHVSTDNASCQATGFTRGQQGFELFGMGFVSDSQGSQDETLWIVGGSAGNGQLALGDLAAIDENTLQVSPVGGIPSGPTYSPELTGTGDAELFFYHPGDLVAQINKQTAQYEQTWALPPLGTVRAWAFAHWGGNFYIFVTVQDFFGGLDSQVQLLDRQTGQISTLLSGLPYVIVGAGVSTCAPVVIE